MTILEYFSFSKDCPYGALLGDGLCNDESNNAECNFDGGDCCGGCIISNYCTECICHPEAVPTLDMSCKYCACAIINRS